MPSTFYSEGLNGIDVSCCRTYGRTSRRLKELRLIGAVDAITCSAVFSASQTLLGLLSTAACWYEYMRVYCAVPVYLIVQVSGSVFKIPWE